jgi:hypothetical protein
MVETQGNKKFSQYLNDLRKNENFIELIQKLKTEKNHKKKRKLSIKLAEKYGIDSDLLFYIQDKLYPNKEDIDWGEFIDVCQIEDSDDVISYEEEHQQLPIKKDLIRLMDMLAYPVSIRIHRLASKRDVLDFIEKRWDYIEKNYLELYRGKNPRIRRRKNQKMYDFIWDNRNKDKKTIKKLLDEKYPDYNIDYFEIYKIIQLERKRRSKDINLGI